LEEGGLFTIVESGMGLGDLRVKGLNLLWSWVFLSWGTGGWTGSWSGGVGSSGIGGWSGGGSSRSSDWSSIGNWLSHKQLLVLDEMEFVALHGDVLTKVLVSVHTGGEALVD